VEGLDSIFEKNGMVLKLKQLYILDITI
jgi:hypothetical protein